MQFGWPLCKQFQLQYLQLRRTRILCPLTIDVTISGTHYAYSRRDGQAEITWLAKFKYNTVNGQSPI